MGHTNTQGVSLHLFAARQKQVRVTVKDVQTAQDSSRFRCSKLLKEYTLSWYVLVVQTARRHASLDQEGVSTSSFHSYTASSEEKPSISISTCARSCVVCLILKLDLSWFVQSLSPPHDRFKLFNANDTASLLIALSRWQQSCPPRGGQASLASICQTKRFWKRLMLSQLSHGKTRRHQTVVIHLLQWTTNKSKLECI